MRKILFLCMMVAWFVFPLCVSGANWADYTLSSLAACAGHSGWDEYITEADVQDFSQQELCYLRNEIYARNGRVFKSPELMEYFSSFSWYEGYINPDDFSEDEYFTAAEKANVKFLRFYEEQKFGSLYKLDQPGYDVYAVRTKQGQGSQGAQGSLRETLLAGNILKLSDYFELDLDGDGMDEEVMYIRTDSDYDYEEEVGVRVNKAIVSVSTEYPVSDLYVTSLDGQNILLMVYDAGPSDDPQTTFLRYQNGDLINVGKIYDYPENLTVDTSDSVIYGHQVCRIVGTWSYDLEWRQMSDGRIEPVPADYYRMHRFDGSDITARLRLPIQVYEDRDYDTATFEMQPQNVFFPYTDAEKWVYVEGADGNGGWYQVNFDTVDEIFEGLVWAD